MCKLNTNNKPNIVSSTVRTIFWNTRSFLQRRNEIANVLQNLDIFICVESWLSEKDYIRFPEFYVFRRDRTHSRGGGILILIRKALDFQEINNITSPDDSVEICGIQLTNVYPSFDILICYRSPGLTLTQKKWDMIVQNLKSDNSLLLGDFNAHSTSWNCNHTDANGQRLGNAIDSYDLYLHNVSSSTYINFQRNYKSNLDLIISTPDIADKINVEVCDETWGSDHFPVFLHVSAEKHQYNKKSHKIKSVRTNWNTFDEILNNNFSQFLNHDFDHLLPNEKYNTIMETITKALRDSTPKQMLRK